MERLGIFKVEGVDFFVEKFICCTMNYFIQKLAYRYRNNKVAKILVRPFYRMKVKREFKKMQKLYSLYALELLNRLKSCLDENGISFWLDFGTLLGAYREHDFIKHDFDLDIGVFYSDANNVRQALIKGGFELFKEFKVGVDGLLGFEQTYRYKGVSVDIFYFHKSDDEMYCNGFALFPDEHSDMSIYQVKKMTFPYYGFETISFKGLELSVPAKTDLHLQAHYGPNFMIPDAHFDSHLALNNYWYPREERIGKLLIFD